MAIGEFVPDPEKKWRAIRLVSVGTAVLTEGMWTHRVMKRRKEEEELRRSMEANCGRAQ